MTARSGSGDASWYEYLCDEACWELLAATTVGRLGVVVDSAPEIYPMNYALDGKTVVLRTDSGNKLRGLDRSPSVCFQIDGFDVEKRTGWSVLIKGRAEQAVDISGVELRPWTLGEKPKWVRIVPAEVTGRRLHRD
jgi:nitroimidazol reductase NimA-like FMN-containing flavoprotein (pyridoxamine 5'-phosphate oxidase superfamily)